MFFFFFFLYRLGVKPRLKVTFGQRDPTGVKESLFFSLCDSGDMGEGGTDICSLEIQGDKKAQEMQR